MVGGSGLAAARGRESGGGWGRAELLREVTGGGQGGCRGKRVKTTLLSSLAERKPAAPEPRAEAGSGLDRPRVAWEGWRRGRPLLGKDPRPSDWGRKRTAGGHTRPQGTREHLCLDNSAQFPLMGAALAKPDSWPCLLRVEPEEMHWFNLTLETAPNLTPFKEDVCSRVKGFESLRKPRVGGGTVKGAGW